ncbi:MAG: hypothetical protein PHY00_02135 [Bacilli bacterium]|nr:hypothetical protein [Bacilli bacterium]
METKVNEKLDNYFFDNGVLVGYLKLMKYFYLSKKTISLTDEKYFYERILKDINYLINKHKGEEKQIEEIIMLINRKVLNQNVEGLIEIYGDLIDVLDILEEGINKSNRYIEGRFTKYKLMKKNITFIPSVDYETIESNRIANSFNCKILKKELNPNTKKKHN